LEKKKKKNEKKNKKKIARTVSTSHNLEKRREARVRTVWDAICFFRLLFLSTYIGPIG